MPDRDCIRIERDGSVAVITLDRPDRMNAIGKTMRTQLYDTLLALSEDDACRAIVLTGAGGNFCAGGDITEMKRRPILEGRARMDLPTRLFRLIATGPKPVVCAVEGAAFGAGLSLVAACDYAVAASDARFCAAFMKVGLLPDYGGLWAIARRVGHRKAFEICAFAETWSAEQARDMEIVNRTCEPGRALAEAKAAAHRLAANPPVAMALLRAALNGGIDTIDQAIATEIDFQSILIDTDDFDEAARAFREKRKPIFTGR